MHKVLRLFSLFLILTVKLTAQIYPHEDARLNYRLVGFSFPSIPGVKSYTIQVAAGNQNNETTFKKNIFKYSKTEKNKLIIEVPAFGKDYSWRTVYTNKGTVVSSPLHHFSTMISALVDTARIRLNVFKSAEKYKDAYVFLDATAALYDMKGNPVWFLPGKDTISKFIDIKLSRQNTITYMGDKSRDRCVVEADYNGNIIWKGPDNGKISGDTTEYYNHEFTKLANGHYMTLGEQRIQWPRLIFHDDDSTSGEPDKNINDTKQNDKGTPFGTIIEYDYQGNIVWSWRSSDYFKNVNFKDLSDAFLHYKTPPSERGIMDTHENSFYFDEKNKVIYVSFRNISTILKIKYPEGKVTNVYGWLAKHSSVESGSDWFCGQHSIKLSQDGYLYLFNNNYCHNGEPPQIVMMQEPTNDKEGLKKIWDYICTNDDIIALKLKEAEDPRSGNGVKLNSPIPSLINFERGGNAVELPDKSMFIDICGKFGKVFIVSRDKQILWSAIPETWTNDLKKWNSLVNYRASIITNPKDLEELIWNSEKE